MPRTKMDDLAEQLNMEEGFLPEEKGPEKEVQVKETPKQTQKEAPKEMPKKKKTFEQTDTIWCRSVIIGGLYLEGAKTKTLYEWRGYGDQVEVEYRDLVSEVRARSAYVFNPWFVIEDEDFLDEYPQVKKFYTESHSVTELRDILSLPLQKMVKEINDLPLGAKDVFKNIASEAVASGTLDSVAKIKAIDEIFDTDLNLLASLSE